MRRVRFFTLLLLTAISAWAVHHDPASPGYELLPDMARSVPYDAFAPNPVTRDGLTYQLPVAGTIARGAALPFHYAATPEDAERAGRELHNPYPHDREVLARGHAVYTTFCAVCHGAMGAGDGPVIPKFPNPPAYTSTRLLTMADGQIFHTITRGTSIMPSYAAQIAPEDRWKVVHWVRELQATKLQRPAEVAQK
jgi:mono/diheme cytochrome c family protein